MHMERTQLSSVDAELRVQCARALCAQCAAWRARRLGTSSTWTTSACARSSARASSRAWPSRAWCSSGRSRATCTRRATAAWPSTRARSTRRSPRPRHAWLRVHDQTRLSTRLPSTGISHLHSLTLALTLVLGTELSTCVYQFLFVRRAPCCSSRPTSCSRTRRARRSRWSAWWRRSPRRSAPAASSSAAARWATSHSTTRTGSAFSSCGSTPSSTCAACASLWAPPLSRASCAALRHLHLPPRNACCYLLPWRSHVCVYSTGPADGRGDGPLRQVARRGVRRHVGRDLPPRSLLMSRLVARSSSVYDVRQQKCMRCGAVRCRERGQRGEHDSGARRDGEPDGRRGARDRRRREQLQGAHEGRVSAGGRGRDGGGALASARRARGHVRGPRAVLDQALRRCARDGAQGARRELGRQGLRNAGQPARRAPGRQEDCGRADRGVLLLLLRSFLTLTRNGSTTGARRARGGDWPTRRATPRTALSTPTLPSTRPSSSRPRQPSLCCASTRSSWPGRLAGPKRERTGPASTTTTSNLLSDVSSAVGLFIIKHLKLSIQNLVSFVHHLGFYSMHNLN